MTAPLMRTVRVDIVDLELVPAGVSIRGDVWAVLTKQVRTTDGMVIGLVPIRRKVPMSGIVDFSTPANDCAGIVVADRGFGLVVGWDLTYRVTRGQWAVVTNHGTTIHVTSASPAVVSYTDPDTPVDDRDTYTDIYTDAK